MLNRRPLALPICTAVPPVVTGALRTTGSPPSVMATRTGVLSFSVVAPRGWKSALILKYLPPFKPKGGRFKTDEVPRFRLPTACRDEVAKTRADCTRQICDLLHGLEVTFTLTTSLLHYYNSPAVIFRKLYNGNRSGVGD